MAPSSTAQTAKALRGADVNGKQTETSTSTTTTIPVADALPSQNQSQSQKLAQDQEGSTSDSQQQPKVRKKRLGVDPSLIISDGRPKRRRTPSPQPENAETEMDKDPKDPQRAKELGYVIYRRIMDSKDPDGEAMAHPFIKLPNKRAFPDYYETIKHPMSLEMVHAKLDAAEYPTLKSVCADLGQIFTNAKRYNVKESLLFQYAKKLHKMTRTYYASITSPEKIREESESEGEHEQPTTSKSDTKQIAMPVVTKQEDDADMDAEGEDDPEGDVDMETAAQAEGEAPSTAGRAGRKRGSYMKDGPSVYKLIKPVLKNIKETKSNDGRDVCAIFMHLPDRRELPDYYKTIRLPISLEEIEAKQLGRRYESWQEFFSDVELMCTNAMEYNEDESEVYQDAKQIMGLLSHLRHNLLLRLENPQVAKVAKSRLSQNTFTPSPASRPSHLPSHLQNYGPGSGTPGSSYSSSPAMMSGLGGYPQSPLAVGQYPPHPSMIPHNTMHGPGSARSVYPPGFGVAPPNGGGPLPGSAPALGPAPGPGPGHGAYLPALPKGVVTEEIVNNLGRYPVYEQQAWAQSLTPLAQNMYRSILASLDARRRGEMGGGGPAVGMNMGMGVLPPTPSPSSTSSYPRQPLPPQPQPQSQPHTHQYSYPQSQSHHQASASPRPIHNPMHPPTPEPSTYQSQPPHSRPHVPTPSPLSATTPLPPSASPVVSKPAIVKPPRPPLPTIKHLDIHFSSTSSSLSSGGSMALNKGQTQAVRLRLRNMRGITNHSLVLNASTSEFELTAYIDDEPSELSTSPSKPASASVSVSVSNGATESGPDATNGDRRPSISGTTTSASQPVTMPELSLRINGNSGPLPRYIYSSTSTSTTAATTTSSNHTDGRTNGAGEDREIRPKGMRWNVHIPTSKAESKIEVVATKPGALAETTTIFVNRQY
ncbi:hypothetical protein I316_06588 [Kwoniella heveanensis BCC8398]|uniref:Bromo domain-containing protein n=1 Tax=Kwoniella heveanensis BCC8398 TaxID=1296120 RepID=A0A1B9GLE6_9TREE|nr:hypothetical protein I316_06588 [Kwoniella heveanensis BCC8398]